MGNRDYDLVIVGGGLVGASLARAVAVEPACAHLRLALVEPGAAPRLPEEGEFDPRVVAITPESEAFLRGLSVWERLDAGRVCPYRDMDVWDGEGSARIHFNGRDLGEPRLGYIVENSNLLSAILEALDECSQVELLRGRKLENLSVEDGDEEARARLQLASGETLETGLVLAADGANSRVRRSMGMATREWDYGQDAIVATVRTECAHRFTAWQRFSAHGPLAFLPLTDANASTHFASIVWSADRARATELSALEDGDFREALAEAFEHRLGGIQWVSHRYSFPLWQRHALTYWRPGVALVGDAAHSIHPLAGQGVNLGLSDARVLAAELSRACQRQLPPGHESVLRRYQRRRQGDNLAMMAVMEAFKRLFGSRAPGIQLLRNTGLRQVDSLPWLKDQLARRAMGLSAPPRPRKL